MVNCGQHGPTHKRQLELHSSRSHRSLFAQSAAVILFCLVMLLHAESR